MSASRLLAAAVTLGLWSPVPGCGQEAARSGAVPDPTEAFQTGRYDEAARAWRALALEGRDRPGAARGWARALAATGRYEEALEALARTASVDPAELARTRGSLLRELGRIDEARAAFLLAIEAGSSDAELARLELAELLWISGERDRALELFDGLAARDRPANPGAEELVAVGTALTYLGVRDPSRFHDAVRAFDRAIGADPGDPLPRVRLGELFLAKYDSRNAGTLIDEALARNPRHAPALLAKARRAWFDGSSEALELTERALEINPRFTAARVFLARLYLELDDVARAEAEARRALETDPVSLEAWTALAGAAYLRGDDSAFAVARDRVLGVDPAHHPLYETLAEVSYRTHRYGDAVRFARRAVELDSLAWSAWASLGLNQLRTGNLAEGRRTLERAFDGDPFNVWVKNTLDLLDELETFPAVESRRFVFRVHPDEAELLALYAPELAERAWDAMAVRYGEEPPSPVSVEMYDRHADFSVRTVGLAGIGALGVSFGSVLAMDAPGAGPGGPFNWGSTLWHEISHAFTLGATDHRVPRWLSEGLAVLDERRARPGWGADPSPSFLVAFHEGRLPTLARFNYGFVRPSYPGQVQHSYFYASLLSEMIEDEYGIGAIRDLLAAYRDGLDTEAAFRRVFDAELDDFGHRLEVFVKARYGSAIDALLEEEGTRAEGGGAFGARLRDASRLRSEGKLEEAVAALQGARDLFPDYAGPDAPSRTLAVLYRERGDRQRAIEALEDFTSRNESDFAARIDLADLREETGDAAGAAAALEEAVWIDPFPQDLHARLARFYEARGDWTPAIRERRALLALGPVDRAAALYHLARALHRAGRMAEARSTVLGALEIAPNYEEALELLLEIRGGP